MRNNDWGSSDYPLCAGHEGVGIVTHVGSGVRTISIGDRVGIAWIRDSCGSCSRCHQGRENICDEGYQGTYLGASAGPWGKSNLRYNEHGGCYTRVQRIEAKFVVRIPDSLSDAVACPLLCGGATMYEVLVNHAPAGVGTRVGILGLGGLGRCGLKLSKLRGNTTVVLSSTPGKREAALAAGADEFWCVAEGEDDLSSKKKLDLIIDSTPVNATHTMMKSMGLLKPNGTFCRVGIPSTKEQAFDHVWIPHIFMQQSITGSVVTGTTRLNELMELCGNNAKFVSQGSDMLDIEVVPFDQINEAMGKLLDRKNKGYRYILKW